jgi:predicted RNA methylase
MSNYFVKQVGNIVSDTKIDTNIFEFRHEKFNEVIPEGSIVLDIGAHAGGFSLMFGSCTGEKGKILAFEPNPKTFESLKYKADNNPQFNIIPYNYACTNKKGKFIFNYSDPSFGVGMNGGFLIL